MLQPFVLPHRAGNITIPVCADLITASRQPVAAGADMANGKTRLFQHSLAPIIAIIAINQPPSAAIGVQNISLLCVPPRKLSVRLSFIMLSVYAAFTGAAENETIPSLRPAAQAQRAVVFHHVSVYAAFTSAAENETIPALRPAAQAQRAVAFDPFILITQPSPVRQRTRQSLLCVPPRKLSVRPLLILLSLSHSLHRRGRERDNPFSAFPRAISACGRF